MEYVTFGKTRRRVSEMCVGTMMFGGKTNQAEAERIVLAAIDRGVDFFDTAASYNDGATEEILGRILKARDRDRLFVCTKVTRSTDSDWIRRSMDESLTRLQVDYVDLFLVHWPRPRMDVEAMMGTLNALVERGKTRHVGCSNFPAWLVAHCNAVAERNGWARLVCNQVAYNAIERGIETEVLPQAVAEGIAITTYRPLLGGVLAGRYTPGEPPPADSRGYDNARTQSWLDDLGERIARYEAIAARLGLHPAQLAVAWVRRSPGVTCPIVGCSTLRQAETTIGAFDVDLPADDHAEINALFHGDEPERPVSELSAEAWRNYAMLRRSFELVR